MVFLQENCMKPRITLFDFLMVLSLIGVNIILLCKIINFPFYLLPVIYFLIVPGYLILRVFKINSTHKMEYFGYSLILSITSLIIIGLTNNYVLPLFNVKEPLGLVPILMGFNLQCFILFSCLLFSKGSTLVGGGAFSKTNYNLLLLLIIPISFPVLCIFGIILLNNGGSNILIEIMLIGISIYTIILFFLRKHLQDYVFPVSLVLISISLLLMYSMRSNHLNGWDVQYEYRVFQLTKAHYYWLPNNDNSAYNSTLGITILPTIISNLISINDELIFKLIYPIIFSFSSVGVYYLLRRNLSGIESFLGTLFFIVQQSFMQQMPSLARQEIAYLAFIYSLLILFDKTQKSLVRKILFLLLSFTLIVSHYSTAYIVVLLYVLTYFLSYILKILLKRNIIKNQKHDFYLNFKSVSVIFLFTLLWYGFYTGTAAGFKTFGERVVINISKIFTEEGKSEQAKVALLGTNKIYTTENIKKYQKAISNDYHAEKKWATYYPENMDERYSIRPKYLSFTSNNEVFRLMLFYLTEVDRKIIKILIIAGIAYSVFVYLFKKQLFVNIEWLIMGCVFLLFIMLIIFIPFVSSAYNVERLYQQSLLFFSFFLISFFVSVGGRYFKNLRYLILIFLIITYFCSYNGMFTQFAGGNPSINLNNSGGDYEQFYVFDSEARSAMWLEKNYNHTNLVYADELGTLRLWAYTKVGLILKDITPYTVDKYSYVYSTYANTSLGNTRVNYLNQIMFFSFPKEFLNDNKNQVYSNGISIIYK